MLLHTAYKLIVPGSRALPIELPFTMTVAPDTKLSLIKAEKNICLVIDRKIDPVKLEVVRESRYYKKLPDGTQEPIPTLKIKDDEAPESVLSQDFISGLIFLTDVPISLSKSSKEDRFVADTKKDQELIKRLGTDKPHFRTSAQISMRSFSPGITTDKINSLMSRDAGLRLYANAIKANLAVAQFRELWRILESAFAKQNDELVDLLTEYPPIKELGFSKAELKKLLVLRGRASHAQSSAGIKEIVYVDKECAKQLPRLKNLCERVILTKKSWGYPTMAIDELLPLAGFMGQNSAITIIKGLKTNT